MVRPVILTFAIAAILSGCASPNNNPVEQDPNQASSTLSDASFTFSHQIESVGDLVIEFHKLKGATCTMHFNATQFLSAPTVVWASYLKPRPDDIFLDLVGFELGQGGIQAFGTTMPETVTNVDGRTKVTIVDDSPAGTRRILIVPGIVEDQELPNFELNAACTARDAMKIAATGTEYLAMFPGSETSGVSFSMPALAFVEARFDIEATRTFTSPHVQAVYFGGGNRAGVVRTTIAGSEQIFPMTTLQLLSFEGGPGEWGFAEAGLQYLAPRFAIVVGTT